MSDARRTGEPTRESWPRRSPNWAVAAWLGAKSALAKLLAEHGKGHDEARDREERVFHPKEH